MKRTSEQEREWILKIAAAEDEALANCTSGVLACSPEQRNAITISIPTDVVEQVKDGGFFNTN